MGGLGGILRRPRARAEHRDLVAAVHLRALRDAHHLQDGQDAPPVMFAVSQSGETAPVLNDVRHARQNGHKIVTFTKRSDSTLAQMSDIVFVVDGSKQTLAGSLPNTFFGHVILAFEELVAFYFDGGHR